MPLTVKSPALELMIHWMLLPKYWRLLVALLFGVCYLQLEKFHRLQKVIEGVKVASNSSLELFSPIPFLSPDQISLLESYLAVMETTEKELGVRLLPILVFNPEEPGAKFVLYHSH